MTDGAMARPPRRTIRSHALSSQSAICRLAAVRCKAGEVDRRHRRNRHAAGCLHTCRSLENG